MAEQRPTLYTPEEIIPVVKDMRGVVQAVAEELGVGRHTIRNYRKRWPEVDDAFKESRQGMTDNIELTLYQKAVEGEPWAVQFYLKTQAKDRGYVERLEVENMVRDEIEAIVQLMEDELPPEVFRQVAAVLARKLG